MSNEAIAALITGLAGLVGVLVGSAISWFSTYALEKRRWAREDSRRFDQQQRQAYVTFLGAIAKLTTFPQADLKNHPEVQAEWLKALSEIELVASSRVYQAAHSYSLIVSEQLFNPRNDAPRGEWYRSRQALIAVIREELGLQPAPFKGD